MKPNNITRDERILMYHEDDHFCVTLRLLLLYEDSDMFTTVTTQNKRNGEQKRWIFTAKELGKAKYCYDDQLRLLF